MALQFARSDQLVVVDTPGLPIQSAVLAALAAGMVRKMALTAAEIHKRCFERVYFITGSILLIQAAAIVLLFNVSNAPKAYVCGNT